MIKNTRPPSQKKSKRGWDSKFKYRLNAPESSVSVFFDFKHSEGRVKAFRFSKRETCKCALTILRWLLRLSPKGALIHPPKGDVCALRGKEKSNAVQWAYANGKYPVGRTAFRVSALLKVEMPKCASPKRSTKSRDILLPVFTVF